MPPHRFEFVTNVDMRSSDRSEGWAPQKEYSFSRSDLRPQTRFTPPLFPATTEKFFKKQENGKFNDGDYVPDPKDVESASAPSNTTDEKNSVALTSEMTMTAQEQADAEAQAKWLRPTDDQVWKKVALFFLVMYCLWVFLLTLSLMGSGFKLLGKDSAKMFDFVDNPSPASWSVSSPLCWCSPPPPPPPSSSPSSARTSFPFATPSS